MSSARLLTTLALVELDIVRQFDFTTSVRRERLAITAMFRDDILRQDYDLFINSVHNVLINVPFLGYWILEAWAKRLNIKTQEELFSLNVDEPDIDPQDPIGPLREFYDASVSKRSAWQNMNDALSAGWPEEIDDCQQFFDMACIEFQRACDALYNSSLRFNGA